MNRYILNLSLILWLSIVAGLLSFSSCGHKSDKPIDQSPISSMSTCNKQENGRCVEDDFPDGNESSSRSTNDIQNKKTLDPTNRSSYNMAVPPADLDLSMSKHVTKAQSGTGSLAYDKGDFPSDPTENEFPNIDLKLLFPKPNIRIESDNIKLKFQLEGFKIGSDTGQYIQIFLNSNPIQKCYSQDVCKITELHTGSHLLQAVPARPWHELVKKEKAFISQYIFVIDEKNSDSENKNAEHDIQEVPQILLGSPLNNNTYVDYGSTSLLFDFIVRNIQLAKDEYGVYYKLILLGTEQFVEDTIYEYPSTWHFDELPIGEYELFVALVDSSGNVIDGEMATSNVNFAISSQD